MVQKQCGVGANSEWDAKWCSVLILNIDIFPYLTLRNIFLLFFVSCPLHGIAVPQSVQVHRSLQGSESGGPPAQGTAGHD